MTRKIFRSIFAVALLVMLASIGIIVGVLYTYFEDEYLDELKNEAIYIAASIEGGQESYLSNIAQESEYNVRITLVDPSGKVLFDNRADPSSMENHSDREEIREASEDGEGSSIRYSDTIDEKSVNYALQLDDGNILRLSGTQFSVWALLRGMIQMIAIVLVITILLSSLLAYRLARKIVRPLNEIDFEHPQDTKGIQEYEELEPLLRKLHSQNRMLQNEMEEREKMRREFTANVSHELKTPLTSISGFAEIIREGLVKEEDISRFAGKIYTESQRLIRLVEDIIKISQLDDEELELERTPVDLSEIVREVQSTLMPEATKHDIRIILKTEPVQIRGIRQILVEMVYNLCDNAVKYNRDGGEVVVSLYRTEDRAVLRIRDTGIGIPKEEQNRVFERFYRVDKSHSKEVGGTGLGLAIVKHAALYHNAQISLRSTLGTGTEITVAFDLSEQETEDNVFAHGKTEHSISEADGTDSDCADKQKK